MRFAFYISGRSGRLSKYLAQAKPKVLNQIGVIVSDYIIAEDLRRQIEDNGRNL